MFKNWFYKNNTSEKKDKIPSTNWVTSRIWFSMDKNHNVTSPEKVLIDLIKNREQYQNTNQPRPNIGHSSVETNDFYSSHWPGETPIDLKGSVRGFNSTLVDDIREEGGTAHIEETFYSLDIEAIQKKHEKMKLEDTSYGLKDKVKWGNEKRKNCSSMSYSLLEAGGINKLSKVCKSLQSSMWAITPNQLASCIKDAKKNELEVYPETQDYTPIVQQRF